MIGDTLDRVCATSGARQRKLAHLLRCQRVHVTTRLSTRYMADTRPLWHPLRCAEEGWHLVECAEPDQSGVLLGARRVSVSIGLRVELANSRAQDGQHANGEDTEQC